MIVRQSLLVVVVAVGCSLVSSIALLLQTMGGGSAAKEHPIEYFSASTLAAVVNYPLWRASALGQSGFRVALHSYPPLIANVASSVPPSMAPYLYAFSPPYKGLIATVLGMSWARAAIFYGSDSGKQYLLSRGYSQNVSTIAPPLVISSAVQCVNMPLVRATILLQNPESNVPNIRESLRQIYKSHGLRGLWHGTSAGILKTVPKYCTAIFVKDYFERVLPPVDPSSEHKERDALIHSAIKSSAAGLAGAALTNPLDVIRNEMFKTNLGLVDAVRLLYDELGWNFLVRGMSKNLVAVSIPVASTNFFTGAFVQYSQSPDKRKNL